MAQFYLVGDVVPGSIQGKDRSKPGSPIVAFDVRSDEFNGSGTLYRVAVYDEELAQLMRDGDFKYAKRVAVHSNKAGYYSAGKGKSTALFYARSISNPDKGFMADWKIDS